MPPRWLRRIVLGPLSILCTVAVLTGLPVLAIAAAAASPLLPGRWRALRVLWFAVVFMVAESVALVALFALWVASGFGWRLRAAPFQAAHYDLMRRYLRAIVATARWTFDLVIDVDETDRAVNAAAWEGAPTPVLVFSRHAGAGDSLLLAEALLHNALRPRVVVKEALQWAPALDVMLHRVPSYFVPPPGRRRVEPTEGIARLAATMRAGDALVLFPEGGNFTPSRRLRSIAKLEQQGRHARAEQARQMRHVLAPRPGGALAAIAASPAADVLFVAHTGLEDLSTVVDVWRGLPMDASVRAAVWRVPAADVPPDPDARTAWLYDWWLQIDAWIIEQQGIAAVPDAVAAAVADRRPDAS
jgi:1-acyl-sn-glycerol-3-phosphate acyltransferase